MSDKPQDDRRDLEELRRLLLGAQLDQVEKLARTVDVPENFSSAVGDILPQAILESSERSDQLSEALVPTVEEIVRLSIKQDINKFADALFPVIGPAIRKSITESIRAMLQSFNQTLEQSFSWQGVKWRMESMRTGLPISQIALLHGLVYRVEQVFLIHGKTGLLLQHVEQEGIQNQNADMVSSMLGAINDFVGDSFAVETNHTLGSIEVGDLSIWIERGPGAILAVAIRGEAPNTLRTSLQLALEDIQRTHVADLDEFAGNTLQFERSRGVLAGCMQAQYQRENKKKSLKTALVWLVLGLLLLYWSGTMLRHSMQENDYVASLEKEPGYVVTRVAEQDGALVVSGMRDPMARTPTELLADSPLNVDEVIHDLEPYQSLSLHFVLARAKKMLQPPQTVALSISNDKLKVEGVASQQWREHLLVTGPAIPGIYALDIAGLGSLFDPAMLNPPEGVSMRLRGGVLYVEGRADNDWISSLATRIAEYNDIARLDTSSLVNLTEADLLADIAMLEEQMILFEAATSSDFDNIDVSKIAALVKTITVLAGNLSKSVIIIAKGSADSLGGHEENVQLSLARAGHVAKKLYLAGVNPEIIEVRGLQAPVAEENSEAERRLNRSVSFEVVMR